MSFNVLVDSFDKIKNFVAITNSSTYDIDLLAGRNTYLDAKSIMGILSCNIAEPMTIIVNCNDEEENSRLKTKLQPYIV